MPRQLLYLIVFIEGFCSLGAEVIALRRLVPHVGSAIVVTAPTIGLFLLALALGYAAGARVSERFTQVVARNFALSALLAGLGLARVTVDGLFAHLQPVGVAYLVFIGGVLCPLAWLLGQTVPVLTNLMKHMRTGEASGHALYWSTLGSFLGSVSLSLGVMQWLGVSGRCWPARWASPRAASPSPGSRAAPGPSRWPRRRWRWPSTCSRPVRWSTPPTPTTR